MARATKQIEIECPGCRGSGKIVKDDPLVNLAMIYSQLDEYDQREVLVYAEYLKQRRARQRKIQRTIEECLEV